MGLAMESGVFAVLLTLGVGLLMMVVERVVPGRAWPRVRGWWARAIGLNAVQVVAVFVGGASWEPWIEAHRGWSIGGLALPWQVAIGYVAITFVYYWWHRARHEVAWLWRWVHQVHHSPARLEIITSFYKHPIEIVINGALSAAILFLLVGVGPEAAAIVVAITGLAELVYHWNIRTPRWLGYFIQRPEMHCVHHQRDLHAYNYADLPIWDLLFGTYWNPPTFDEQCGFGPDEHRLGEMLRGVDVVGAPTRARTDTSAAAALLILGLGLTQMTADVLGMPRVKGLAAATGASPAPKVFSATDGYEGFSTAFSVRYRDRDGADHEVALTPQRYAQIRGPYNRRNAFGAVVAFAPVARRRPELKPAWDAVAHHGLCGRAPLLTELGIDPESIDGPVQLVFSPRPGTDPKYAEPWTVQCK